MEQIWNIGERLKTTKYDNYFVKFEYDKSSDKVVETFFKEENGVVQKTDFDFEIVYKDHKIKLSSFLALDEVFNGGLDFKEACKRAEKFNKRVIGFYGKNKYKEKLYIVQCKICGFVKRNYVRFFYRCMGCKKIASTKTFDEFVRDARLKHDDRYDYPDGEYIHCESKIRIFCKKCKIYFNQTPHSHLTGCGCPKCNESKGEKRVARYLKKRGIAFEPQQEFKDLKHKGYLKFDFYMTEINILLEYDGEGHYHAIHGSTPEEKEENLRNQQFRDRLKDEYAKANNIPLLRIPYWDFKRIEEIIDAFILEVLKQREEQQLVLDI